MALQNLLGDLATDATQQELLTEAILLLSAMVKRMPRLDSADRAIVNASEAGITLAASQTLATVTTVGTINQIVALGSGRASDAMPAHLGNAGSMHLYNNIIFS